LGFLFPQEELSGGCPLTPLELASPPRYNPERSLTPRERAHGHTRTPKSFLASPSTNRRPLPCVLHKAWPLHRSSGALKRRSPLKASIASHSQWQLRISVSICVREEIRAFLPERKNRCCDCFMLECLLLRVLHRISDTISRQYKNTCVRLY